MGWIGNVLGLRGVENAAALTTGSALLPHGGTHMASPWSDGDLATIVARDIFGPDVRVPLTRREAMGVPAAARARHLITSDLAGAPLRSMTGTVVDADQPLWMSRTDTFVSPWHRMVWTVDDLIWHGWSLWARKNAADGTLLDAARVDYSAWSFDGDGQVLIAGLPARPDQVVLIPGPHEGVLTMARDTIRVARDLEMSVADRAANPAPLTELHQTTDDQLDQEEVVTYLEAWRQARRTRGGSVAFTPSGLEVREHGASEDQGAFLVNARNASAIDVVRYIGIPAAMVDASNVNSTLTYETLQGRNQEYLDRCLRMYAGAVESRLSLDDVVPRGHRVAFDFTELSTTTPSATGADQKD